MTWNSTVSLRQTWERIKASRGRDGRKDPAVGLDGVTRKTFDRNLEKNIKEIERKLNQSNPDHPSGSAYEFAPFRNKTISSEPGKSRQIQIPRIRDQIVLRALSDEISRPLIERYPAFLKTSPRGVVKQVIAAREDGMNQIMRTDVNQYYPSIPHKILLEKLALLPLEPSVIQLTQKALAVPFRDKRLGKRADRPTKIGTATGTSLSTVLGEFFLMDLEDNLFSKDVKLIRYVDDILLLTKDEEKLAFAHQKLIQKLNGLGLRLSKSKTSIKSFEQGFEFLGFSFLGDQVKVSEKKSIKWIRTYQGIIRKFARAIQSSKKEEESHGLLERMTWELNREISGATGMQVPYYSLADDLSAFKDLDRQVRENVGGIFRRLGKKMNGSYRIESAFSWAWKYKKDYQSAKIQALDKFPEISVACRALIS